MSIYSKYPYVGQVYRFEDFNNLPPSQRPSEPTSLVVATIDCDVQEYRGQRSDRGASIYSYSIFFEGDISGIREGDLFSADVLGRKVDGIIRFVFSNEMGHRMDIEDVTND